MSKRDDKIREVLAETDAILARIETRIREILADVPPEQALALGITRSENTCPDG